MNKYKITILRNSDKMLPFIVTVNSMNQEDAVIRAKNFVAENGHWPINMSITDRIKHLSVSHIEIQLINSSTAYYY